ncbi:MAG: glycosyltransferase family 4 protein, partial [Candidatus Limnocylindria bacterium]
LQEAGQLAARGHDVRVLAPIVDARTCFPELIAKVGPRQLLPRLPNIFGVGDGLTLLVASAFAKRLVRDVDADVYLGANQPGAWLARQAARAHGRRYVIYLNQPNRLLEPRAIDRDPTSVVVRKDFFLLSGATLAGRPLLSVLDRLSVRDAAARLGDGPHMTAVLRSHYGGDWRDCPGATVPAADPPTDLADRPRAEVNVNGARLRGPIVLLTNRHYPQKRFEWMFPVIRAVHDAVPTATLVITGEETVYTDRLRAALARDGLQHLVRFLGLVTEGDLLRLYRAATAYVYPSPEEDFGLGLVEAMGQGTPVVAWNNAGPSGIVEDGVSGRLVPLDDHAGFAAAVTALVTDGALRTRLGLGAWRRATDRFSFRAHTDILEQALRDAAG